MPSSLRRRLGGALVAGAAIAVASVAMAAGAAASPADADGDAYTGELTFDWPLGCAFAVSQQYLDAAIAIDVSYDVELAETDGGIEAVFGQATVLDALVEGFDDGVDHLADALGAFFTTPTLDIELDGSGADSTGFRDWLAEFRAVGPSEEEAATAGLQREIDYRSREVIWQTWVGLWATLADIDDDWAELDDMAYVDELGDRRSAPLIVESLADSETDDAAAALRAQRELTGPALEALLRHGVEPATEAPAEYDADADQRRVTTFAVTTAPATLQPQWASYEVVFDDGSGPDTVVAYEWSFDWRGCGGERSVLDVAADAPSEAQAAEPDDDITDGYAPRPGVTVPSGMPTMIVDELPDEAIDTMLLIEIGGPFPYRQDGTTFENREGLLPERPHGHYREYTVDTPGAPDRGARRIVTGDDGEIYYTDDHYSSFTMVLLPVSQRSPATQAARMGAPAGASAPCTARTPGRSLRSLQEGLS